MTTRKQRARKKVLNKRKAKIAARYNIPLERIEWDNETQRFLIKGPPPKFIEVLDIRWDPETKKYLQEIKTVPNPDLEQEENL